MRVRQTEVVEIRWKGNNFICMVLRGLYDNEGSDGNKKPFSTHGWRCPLTPYLAQGTWVDGGLTRHVLESLIDCD